MKPGNLNLEMWSDSAFNETLTVTLNGAPQDFTGWEFKSLACETVIDSAQLFAIDVTPVSAGSLGLFVAPEALQAAFPQGDTSSKKMLPWVLKAKPGVAYPVRIAYGTITLHRGLPPWV